MNNRTVAKRFAEGEIKGNGSNLYIEGNTIYSYGSHFPLAIHTDIKHDDRNIILFNSDSYSNTTSKHQSYVRGALGNDYYLVNIPTKAMQAYSDYIRYNDNTYLTAKIRRDITGYLASSIEEAEKKAARARKEWNKEYYSNQVINLNQQLDIVKYSLIPLHPKHVI